jgi:HK97 family phage major capsid protein
MSDITKLKDDLEQFVAKGQQKFSELESQGKSNSEGLEKLLTDFTEKSAEFTTLADQIRAMQEEQKQLENLMARKGADSSDKSLGDPEYQKAFSEFVRKGGAEMIKDDQTIEKALGDYAAFHGLPVTGDVIQSMKAGLVGSNPDGGFLAPIDPVRFISQRIFESSPVRQIANVISTAREAVQVIVDDDQAGFEWVGEVDERSETNTPQIAEIEIPTHEQAARPKLSRKAIDDVTINFETWLQGKVADRFARGEAGAFVTGDGVKKPRGILDYPSWTTQGEYERGGLEHRETAGAGAIAGDDFISIQSDLLEGYQANASWMMHRKIWSEIVKLKGSDNNYLLSPQLLFSGIDMQLLGRPVRFSGDMPSAVSGGNSIVIYGNFGEGYTIVDRIGIRVLRDPYTDKRYIEYYTTRRVGGAVTNYQALKVLDVQS